MAIAKTRAHQAAEDTARYFPGETEKSVAQLNDAVADLEPGKLEGFRITPSDERQERWIYERRSSNSVDDLELRESKLIIRERVERLQMQFLSRDHVEGVFRMQYTGGEHHESNDYVTPEGERTALYGGRLTATEMPKHIRGGFLAGPGLAGAVSDLAQMRIEEERSAHGSARNASPLEREIGTEKLSVIVQGMVLDELEKDPQTLSTVGRALKEAQEHRAGFRDAWMALKEKQTTI